LTANASKKPGAGLNFLLDFGPLLVFFLTYTLLGSLIVGTAVFMVAILIALVASLALFGRVSPMTWISAILILGFGGLTIYFNDPRFIQMKPTIIYAGFALLLFAGLLFGKPLLKHVFGMAFEGLSDTGWLKLTRNWAIFFAAMALLNEALRAWLTFDAWLAAKVWGITILSLLFAFANIPMLMRHGFSVEAKEETPPVPPQL
jgi:intracellular septation protein